MDQNIIGWAARRRRMGFRGTTVVALVLYLLGDPVAAHGSVVSWLFECAGVALIALGALGRVYALLYSGGWKNSRLVVTGPYSVVRNPLYVATCIAIIGVGLLTASAIVTAILAVGFFVSHGLAIRYEERFLESIFGEAYTAYLHLAPRWIPSFRLWQAPDEVPVRPRFILKGMLDVAPLFLMIPVIDAVRSLHEARLLPTLYALW